MEATLRMFLADVNYSSNEFYLILCLEMSALSAYNKRWRVMLCKPAVGDFNFMEKEVDIDG